MVAYSPTVRNEDLDEYLTPPKLIEATVALLPFEPEEEFYALDPGANLGQWGSGVKTAFPNAHVTGVEIMEGITPPGAYAEWHTSDFLAWQASRKYDLIISNPPYSKPIKNIAELFIRKSFGLIKPGGYLFFLLRTNFANAKKRSRGLFKEFPFKQELRVDRPHFFKYDPRTEQFGTNKTNRHDYSIYIWQRGYEGIPTLGWLLWDGK